MIRALYACVCLTVVVGSAVAQDLSVLPAEIDGVASKDMMHAYLMRRVGEALDRRDAAYEDLETPEQLAAYQERLRRFFVDQLGGFPERTPLNPQVVAKLDRDGYRVEKVIYQSQPRHYVTATLYLPEAEPPYPGVLVPCGHSNNGKGSEVYQLASILLARNGIAALCYDPIDQGERFQLLDENGKPKAGGTTAHCLVGVGSTLLGRNTATFRVWDGMRSIDYLAGRPEVDPKRIGCTGNSGGGTLTSYLMALDDRIACAAPSCYLTTLRRLCETIGPQDAEQNIHAQIAFGMDHPDYVIMRAPKPTLICAATQDFFNIGGTWENFRQAKRFYSRLGHAERVDLVETDMKHGFSAHLRVGMARWMRRWLLGVDDAVSEPESAVLSDAEIQCTPDGQVMLLDGARSVYDLNADLEEQLARSRKRLWQKTDRTEAMEKVRRITGIRKLDELPKLKCKKVDTLQRDGCRVDKLVLCPEPGVWLPAAAFVPNEPTGEATLYLHSEGTQADAGPGGPIEALVKKGHVVLAVDLRGLGETASKGSSKRGISYHVGPQWKDFYLAYLLDTSYLAMRTEDVMVCGRFLAEYPSASKPSRVHLVSVGRTGPAALHAAALEPGLFASVKLRKCLISWSNVVRTPMAVNQFENVVHGGLKVYDLPDLRASLPKGKLTFSEPLDAREEPIPGDAP
ncbi:MAG: alpha/beta hydrolase family protein [Planctomycetota bacterium]|jgi:cephalosporin-C deacetylase-like acetyl esterase